MKSNTVWIPTNALSIVIIKVDQLFQTQMIYNIRKDLCYLTTYTEKIVFFNSKSSPLRFSHGKQELFVKDK